MEKIKILVLPKTIDGYYSGHRVKNQYFIIFSFLNF